MTVLFNQKTSKLFKTKKISIFQSLTYDGFAYLMKQDSDENLLLTIEKIIIDDGKILKKYYDIFPKEKDFYEKIQELNDVTKWNAISEGGDETINQGEYFEAVCHIADILN